MINSTAGSSGFSKPVNATRDVLPSMRLSHTNDDVLVSVVPRSFELSQATRVSRLKRYSVDVGVMKRAQQQEDLNVFVEELVDLTNEIRETLSDESMGGATFIAATIDPIYSAEHLKQQRLFLSIIRLEYGSL